MRKLFPLVAGLLTFQFSLAQPKSGNPPVYTIQNMALPPELDKQVCISGMKYMNQELYLASERCPIIFVLDPSNGSIKKTISLKTPAVFEMEGLSSYRDKLYLISEDIAAVYEMDPATNQFRTVSLSSFIPEKTKNGDGMEGIATSELHQKFYLLRERNENQTFSQIYTYSVAIREDQTLSLKYESTIELPLENPQWRYSDICIDQANSRLLLLKSYSKGKTRQQFLESLDLDNNGMLLRPSLKNVDVENFSGISGQYKDQGFSMNLEGVTVDENGKLYMVSDNHNGKAQCESPAKERTILFVLDRKL